MFWATLLAWFPFGETVDGKWLLQTDLDGCPSAMPGAYGVLQPVLSAQRKTLARFIILQPLMN